jgi:coenzyme F420 hydrogenase subunit beta
VVTALLIHLFDRGRIDGAIVAKQVGPFQRRPYLATTREEILESAGFYFDTLHGMHSFSEQYMTYSSIEEFDPMVKKGLGRVALVGTPCQIQSVRRMQVLGLVPSDSIQFCFGLFCSGNFTFGEKERSLLARTGGFSWDEVVKVNIKEDLMVHLKTGEFKTITLKDLEPIRRYACRYCGDYSAEYADIAFGGIGADEGWTTTINRTPLGRAVLADAKSAGVLDAFKYEANPTYASSALNIVQTWSSKKKQLSSEARRAMGPPSVRVGI